MVIRAFSPTFTDELVLCVLTSCLFVNNDLVCSVADIRRSTRPFLEDKRDDDFFQIDVRVFHFQLFFSNFYVPCYYKVKFGMSYF